MDSSDVRFFSGDRLRVRRGRVNRESLECLQWRPKLRCVMEDVMVPAYVGQTEEIYRKFRRMRNECVFGYRQHSMAPSDSGLFGQEIATVYKKECNHTMFFVEDQVCDRNLEYMMRHCTDRATAERCRVGFPHTFELAERRVYWVDSYNITYRPGVSGLDEEVAEKSSIGKQYRDAAQFMVMTRAVVEMMERVRNCHLTSDYLQYVDPAFRFYNWIPNQDAGYLAGADVVASECGKMAEQSGGYYPVPYNITTGVSLDKCLFKCGATLYVRSIYPKPESLVKSYERVMEHKGSGLWDRLRDDACATEFTEDAERRHVAEGHGYV